MPKILSNKTNGFLQASSNDFSRFFLWETAKAVTTNPKSFFEQKSGSHSPIEIKKKNWCIGNKISRYKSPNHYLHIYSNRFYRGQ